MDVKMPDGTLIRNVPDDVTQEDLMERYSQLSTPQEVPTASNPFAETISNIPSSAFNFAKNIVEPILSPVETFNGLRSAYRGAISNVLPKGWVTPYEGQEQDVATADAVGGFYKERFGGLENIRNTIVKDPVGAAADASLVLGLGSKGLRAAGLSKTASAVQTASQVTDPLFLAGKAVTTVGKPAYKAFLGQTTGAGARVIDEALSGGKEFINAMRGKTSEGEIVEKAKDALDDIRQARGDAYRAKLDNLKNTTQQLNIDDVKVLADDQLKRYNVGRTPTGELDFSRSSASGASAKEIGEVYKMVQDWGSQPGDLTPAMLDILKRRLDDFYSEGRTSRAMVTTLKKAVQEKLVKAVPEYAEMTKDYAKASDVIKEMERAVGLGNKTAADTAIRKLTMALREDKNFRADLLKTLEASTGENVTAAVAGATMRPIATRGLGSVVAGGVGITGLLTTSPMLAALIPMASPRLVGELSVLLGKLGKTAPYGRGAGITAYQTGRLPLEQ